MISTSFLLENRIETARVGGLPIACLTIAETADLMMAAVSQARRQGRPIYMTSANGEVIARCMYEPEIAQLFECADLISADGQPMVLASKLVCKRALPERVATTDLLDFVAERAAKAQKSFYLLGGEQEVAAIAAARIKARHPELRIVGHSHGYFSPTDAPDVADEINRVAPDILWIGMGVPREQSFVVNWAHRMTSVGVIKTAGGLFDFVSGRVARAPSWIQASGFEWAWRMAMEPKRLFWRYAVTNPVAMYAMIRKSN